jgi:hypothetical protein
MRRLPLASVLLTAHALLLRIQSPADNACVPSTTAVIVEVLVEHDDPDDVAGQLRDARICVEGRGIDGAIFRSCAVPGGGEAHVDLPKGTTVDLTATMELLDATRATTPSTIRVSTTTDDTHLTCEDGRDPFPLTDATRRALKLKAQALDRGALDINWPRPGTLVRSPTVAVSINVAFPNGTLARPEGTSCVTMRSLDDEGAFVESCVEVAAETEHLEFRVPWVTKTRIGLALSVDGRTSLPLDLTVDPATRRPPLPESYAEGYPEGWVLRPHSQLHTRPLVLVVCRYGEDLDWLRYQPHPAVVYEKHRDRVAQAGLHGVPRNTANEASAFLKFIVDYYDDLPEVMVFLHGHRYAYHQEDVLTLLDAIEDPSTLPGYCNLNLAVWGLKEDPSRKPLYEEHKAWLEAWLGPLPPLLLDRCCAQFVVRRERVLHRPKAFFEEALQHAYYDVEPLPEGDSEANRRLGLLFEWLWHYLFGEPAVAAELGDFVDGIDTTHLVYLAGARRRPSCVADGAGA